ncbi:hypothetical protein BpHYR1_012856 [Brachionus plicatilis]|uniref:Uncharacterized protein n=1 Tax=Brachionus plicatilis TaxID=10195 RepID=A0A3M7RZP0_BRAPC|nr:hypothetical protein BpHYR1_012856 [Brachionus plicatilis]
MNPILKLVIALLVLTIVNCLTEDQFRDNLPNEIQDSLMESKIDNLREKYIKLRPILDKIFQLNELNQDSSPKEFDPEKRSFFNFDSFEKPYNIMKRKRLNRNMFASGLQGVWGVPGKK